MTGEYSSSSWILDTGASHHLTGSLSCMTATRSIAACPIGLPDGHTANATMEGLDQRSGSLIGAGERKEGLYYYRRVPIVCAVTVSGLSQFELCHLRLGHPSNRVLKLVPDIQHNQSRKPLDHGTPSHILGDQSPFQVLLGTVPPIDHLWVFRCLCFAHDKQSKGDKFASRSRRCMFVGYPNTQKGWKLYDLESKEIFVSRDVKFYETEFPFLKNRLSSFVSVSPRQDVSGASGVLTSYLDDEEDIGEVSMVSTYPFTLALSSTDPSISVPSSPEVVVLPEHATSSPTLVTPAEP
ncbi:hypothetical protein LIER_10601 [Lithospermum erythrorhizon]|uniref:Retroviral polymerase SH3-like domain-containing protein n=1 Tax=Lithospermum erythrorhizon TaxID=34254 RepID=A0AAV3PL63_LITER